MIAIGALLAFLGFFAGYNTSQKAVLTGNSKLELLLKKNTSVSRIFGVLLLVASLAVFIVEKGIGAGTFVFFVTLMTVGSLIVVLFPIKILNLKTAAAAFAFVLAIELLNLA